MRGALQKFLIEGEHPMACKLEALAFQKVWLEAGISPLEFQDFQLVPFELE